MCVATKACLVRLIGYLRNKFDYVFHAAAKYGRWNGEDYYENLWATNARGTKNMLRVQKKKSRMIFFGGAEVYGKVQRIFCILLV
jgi:nucleoside-diphosphate-sugar epimerase